MSSELERYEKSEICIMADEQFSKLNAEDQQLYLLLKKSFPVLKLSEDWYGSHKPIINFKTKKENSRTYFSFDIARPLSGSRAFPDICYGVEGSVIYGEQYKNIVYTIYWGNGVFNLVYVDNYTNIDKNMILNEVIRIDPSKNISVVESVVLNVFNMAKQDEKFIIKPDSDIYKLYLSRQIDINTLCNLALLQATHRNSKVVEGEQTSFTKLLNKRFI